MTADHDTVLQLLALIAWTANRRVEHMEDPAAVLDLTHWRTAVAQLNAPTRDDLERRYAAALDASHADQTAAMLAASIWTLIRRLPTHLGTG